MERAQQPRDADADRSASLLGRGAGEQPSCRWHPFFVLRPGASPAGTSLRVRGSDRPGPRIRSRDGCALRRGVAVLRRGRRERPGRCRSRTALVGTGSGSFSGQGHQRPIAARRVGAAPMVMRSRIAIVVPGAASTTASPAPREEAVRREDLEGEQPGPDRREDQKDKKTLVLDRCDRLEQVPGRPPCPLSPFRGPAGRFHCRDTAFHVIDGPPTARWGTGTGYTVDTTLLSAYSKWRVKLLCKAVTAGYR